MAAQNRNHSSKQLFYMTQYGDLEPYKKNKRLAAIQQDQPFG
jgi:hypothetical protein